MYLVLSLPEGKHMVESIFIINHPLQKKVYNFLEHIQVSSIHTLSFIHCLSLSLFFFGHFYIVTAETSTSLTMPCSQKTGTATLPSQWLNRVTG